MSAGGPKRPLIGQEDRAAGLQTRKNTGRLISGSEVEPTEEKDRHREPYERLAQDPISDPASNARQWSLRSSENRLPIRYFFRFQKEGVIAAPRLQQISGITP